MITTPATQSIEGGARHPERLPRPAAPAARSPEQHSPPGAAVALIAWFGVLGATPAGAQTQSTEISPDEPINLAQAVIPTYPGIGGGADTGFAPGAAAYGRPTVTAAGTTYGVKPRPIVASIGITETYTNNVNLTASSQAKSDFVTELVPQLTINEQGPHASLNGYLAVPILLYARTSENDQVYPSIGLVGRVEALERFLFVEGAVSVTQQYFTPFGGQPVGLSNASANRYTSETYRVTPYIKGVTPGNIRYELRNNNIWTDFSNAPTATSNAYYNQWLGNIASPVAPWGWAADYEYDSVKFEGQAPLVTNLGRGRVLYQVDPEIQVSVVGGYEDNRYTFTDYSGPIYGGGIRWNPSLRTAVIANWEHRFFGSSYFVSFDHHGPLSVVGVRASRNITSYPQQLLTLAPTGNVSLLLNSIFSSRIPDQAQRQAFIDSIIQGRGLPNELTSPVNLYAQQILLIEDVRATIGALGARNSVFLTGFYVHSEPISGAGTPLPPELALGNNNTQRGIGLTWTHALTPTVTLSVAATGLRTVANPPLVGTTKQGNVIAMLSTTLSPDTQAFCGARYQKLNSDVATNYSEAAVFAGLYYVFK